MSKGHGAILQIPDSQKFWTPSPPARDPHPCLEVEFKGNHVITAIELKGMNWQSPQKTERVYLIS